MLYYIGNFIIWGEILSDSHIHNKSITEIQPKTLPTWYVDDLVNNAQDLKDIERAKKKVLSSADKVIIRFLAFADIAMFIIIGMFVLLNGGGNAYDDVKGESAFSVQDSYYTSSEAMSNLKSAYADTGYPEYMLDKFKALYSVNKDTIAWVKLVDSSIDMVVTQASDNEKYLRKDFYLQYDVRGTVFMDYRNTVTKDWDCLSKNTVLYGHSFSEYNQMIFDDIKKYTDLDYYISHPIILMDTIYNSYKWKVIGAFMVYPIDASSSDLFYYWATDFSDDITIDYANEVKLRSYIINPSVDILPSDKFLTLSTCIHIPTKSGEVVGRFVLVSRLVRQGENPAVDTSLAYENEDRRMPQVWYDYNGITNPYTNTPVWSAF